MVYSVRRFVLSLALCYFLLVSFVFVYHSDLFDFYVFALMQRLCWEPLCEPNFLCISVVKVASGPRMVG